MNAVAAVAHYGALSDVGPFRAADARALIEKVSDVSLGPAGALDMLPQLLGNHNGVVAAIDRIVPLVRPHLRSKRLQNLFRVSGPLVHDLPRSHRRHHGYGREALGDAAHDGQRLPG